MGSPPSPKLHIGHRPYIIKGRHPPYGLPHSNPILVASQSDIVSIPVGCGPLLLKGASQLFGRGGGTDSGGTANSAKPGPVGPSAHRSGKIGWAILSWAKIPSWYSKQRGLLHSREPHALLFYGRRPPKLRYIGQSGYALFYSL